MEEPVAKLKEPFIEVGAIMMEDLLEGVPDKLKDDLLERPTKELFLVFVVFKVVFKAEVKCEVVADGVAIGCANELLLDLTIIFGMNPIFSPSVEGFTPLLLLAGLLKLLSVKECELDLAFKYLEPAPLLLPKE